MNFLYNQPPDEFEVSLAVQASREAWTMLMTFGDEVHESIDPTIPTAPTDAEIHNGSLLNFKAYSTPYFVYGPNGLFYFDQFPEGDLEMRGYIGFIALHMETLSDEDENYAQVVFRLESHQKGAAVFEGDNKQLQEVRDDDRLAQIILGLRFLSHAAWIQYLEHPSSLINTHPSSDLLDQFDELLAAEIHKEGDE